MAFYKFTFDLWNKKKKKLVSLYNSNKFVETETESCLSFSSILPNYRSVLVTLTRESLEFGRILDFRNIMYVGFRLRTFGILKKDPTFNFCSRGYHVSFIKFTHTARGNLLLSLSLGFFFKPFLLDKFIPPIILFS